MTNEQFPLGTVVFATIFPGWHEEGTVVEYESTGLVQILVVYGNVDILYSADPEDVVSAEAYFRAVKAGPEACERIFGM